MPSPNSLPHIKVWLLCIEKVQNRIYVMEWVFLSGVCAGTKIRLTAIGGTPEAGRSRDPHQASSLIFTLASSRSFLLISYEKSHPPIPGNSIVSPDYIHVKLWDVITQACLMVRDGLTHWGRVTHICVSNLTIIGSENGLSPGRRQPIIWTTAGMLLIGPLGTNFNLILLEIHTFSLKNPFNNIVWKMAAILSRPQCVKQTTIEIKVWMSN